MAKGENIKIFEFGGKRITFDFGDGMQMINATEMVKVFDKRLDNFMRLKQTKEFIKALESVPSDVRERKIIRVVRGGTPDLQGTWIDELLALKLASWLSPQFEIWVYSKIRELLTTGKTELESERLDHKELNFWLQKIADNTLEASRHSQELLDKIKKTLPPKA